MSRGASVTNLSVKIDASKSPEHFKMHAKSGNVITVYPGQMDTSGVCRLESGYG